jgi:mannose-1-phosphate guanylyltransferase
MFADNGTGASPMKAMILAAGEGSRMAPLTSTCPKPMLPVAGKPGLEWIVAWLRINGVTDVMINLHHLPEAVLTHFGDGAAFGVSIEFSREEPILGTAGGVKRVEQFFEDTVTVVYGDVLTDLDLHTLLDFHHAHGPESHVTLSLYQTVHPTQCGIVALDETGRVKRFVEKPAADNIFSDLANAGVLIIDRPLLDYVPTEVFYDLSNDLLPLLLERGLPIYGQRLSQDTYLIDFGTPETYERVQHEWPTARLTAALELEERQ